MYTKTKQLHVTSQTKIKCVIKMLYKQNKKTTCFTENAYDFRNQISERGNV